MAVSPKVGRVSARALRALLPMPKPHIPTWRLLNALTPTQGGSYGSLNHLLHTPQLPRFATEPVPFSRRPELRRAQWWGCGGLLTHRLS